MDTFLTTQITQKLSDIIPHFLFSLSSQHTRRAYLNDLKNFCEFLNQGRLDGATSARTQQNKNVQFLSDIDDTCVCAWKEYLEQKLNLDPSSVRRKLNCLSALFVFAQKRKFIDKNPVTVVKKPAQKHESKTNALMPDDMKQIFSNIKQKIEEIRGNQENKTHYERKLSSLDLDYAVLSVLCGTGLRVNEVCHLRLCNLEIQSSNNGEKSFVLHVNKAKGNKEHKVYLNAKTAEVIFNYIDKYRKNAHTGDFLFVRAQSAKSPQNEELVTLDPKIITSALTPKSIYNMVATNAQEAQIIKKVSPHSIRAGVATFLHGKGVPLARIQKQLGHSDVATTSVYIKKSNEIEESAALKLSLDSVQKNEFEDSYRS